MRPRGIFSWLAGLAWAGFVGCDDSVECRCLSPRLEVVPWVVEFGTQPIGTAREVSLSIENIGSARLVVSSIATKTVNDITVSSTLAIDCDSTSSNATTTTLDEGDCGRIAVRFDASQAETITNVVEIRSNDPTKPVVDVPVTASAAAIPQIQVEAVGPAGADGGDASSLDFGTVAAGQNAMGTVVITSVGNLPLTITDLILMPTSTDLSIDPPMLPLTLDPQASVSVDVTLSSHANGRLSSDLIIDSNAFLQSEVSVSITAAEPYTCGVVEGRIVALAGAMPLPSSGVPQNTTVTLEAASNGPVPVTYVWSLLAQPDGGTAQISGTGSTVTLDCTEPGIYEVGLLAEASNGCDSAPTSVSILVNASD